MSRFDSKPPYRSQTPPGINDFPVELLSSIFRLAKTKPPPHLGTVDIHRQNLSILGITRVCRHWRAVAIQDSSLWNNISFSTSKLSTIRCADEFLRRSRRAMINVQIIDIPSSSINPYCALVASLVEDIARQSHRIVEFEVVGLSKPIGEALVYPANNLCQLRIDGHGFEELPLVFGGMMPRLSRLTLSNPSGWNLGAFPEVTNVSLFCGGNGVGAGSLVDFLGGASKLKVLSLSRCHDSGSPEVVQKPISLPHLCELNLSFCDSPQILSHLVLPHSACVSILTSPGPEHRNIFCCIPNTPGFRLSLYDTQSLTVVLHPSDNEFYLSMHGRDKPSFFLRVCEDKRKLDWRWILRSINSAPSFKPFLNIESLTVSVENYSIPWKSWLPQLEGLVRIEVASVDPNELILALTVTRPNRKRLLCPSLRCLSVESKRPGKPIGYFQLRSCLVSRAKAGHPVSRLRVRSEVWARMVQVHRGWEELVISQGDVTATLCDYEISLCTPEPTEGFTSILMKRNPTN